MDYSDVKNVMLDVLNVLELMNVTIVVTLLITIMEHVLFVTQLVMVVKVQDLMNVLTVKET